MLTYQSSGSSHRDNSYSLFAVTQRSFLVLFLKTLLAEYTSLIRYDVEIILFCNDFFYEINSVFSYYILLAFASDYIIIHYLIFSLE